MGVGFCGRGGRVVLRATCGIVVMIPEEALPRC